MTRILRAEAPWNDVSVVPSFSPLDLDRVLAEFAAATEDDICDVCPKVANGSGAVLFWGLTRCLKFNSSVASDLLRAVAVRESLDSTALVKGFAGPHIRSPLVDRGSTCVIRLDGLAFDFESVDRKPVRIFALRVFPIGDPDLSLSLTEKLFRTFSALAKTECGAQDVAREVANSFGILQPYQVEEAD